MQYSAHEVRHGRHSNPRSPKCLPLVQDLFVFCDWKKIAVVSKPFGRSFSKSILHNATKCPHVTNQGKVTIFSFRNDFNFWRNYRWEQRYDESSGSYPVAASWLSGPRRACSPPQRLWSSVEGLSALEDYSRSSEWETATAIASTDLVWSCLHWKRQVRAIDWSDLTFGSRSCQQLKSRIGRVAYQTEPEPGCLGGGGQKIVKTVKAQSSVNDNKYRPTARVAQEKILKFLVRYISSSHGRVVWSLSKYTFVTEWFPMATGLDIWLYLTVCNWSPNNCFQFLDLNLQDYRGQASTGTSCMCSVKTHDVRFLLRRSYLCLCTDLHMANRY